MTALSHIDGDNFEDTPPRVDADISYTVKRDAF